MDFVGVKGDYHVVKLLAEKFYEFVRLEDALP